MTVKQFFAIRMFLIVTLGVGNLCLLIWDYFHGGVPLHHILNSEDLPGFSNWWGALLIPVLTWFLMLRIEKRIQSKVSPLKILYAALAAVVYGFVLSLFFTFGNTDLPFYWVISLLALSFFFPIYLSECFLGCVVGMVYTFGGVLPLLIVSMFSIFGAIIYLGIRPMGMFVIKKIMGLFRH